MKLRAFPTHIVRRSLSLLLALLLLILHCAPALAETEFKPVDLIKIDDPGQQMATLACAQEGLNLRPMYNAAWCAYFVGTCARMIGQGEAIPYEGGTERLYKLMPQYGGQEVTSPKAGDLVFYFGTDPATGEIVNHTGLMINDTQCVNGNINNVVTIAYYKNINKSYNPRIVFVRPAYRPQVPIGNLDIVTGGYGSIRVAGWAKDKDTPGTPVPIHIYVGGEAGSGASLYTTTTSIYREDIGGVYGFDETFYVRESGTQSVYVYALDTNGGENRFLGSSTVSIGENQAPEGALGSASGGMGTVRVSGWAYDMDTPDRPVNVHVYVGGEPGSGAPFYIVTADEKDASGHFVFDEVIPVTPTGQQTLYLFVINTTAGYNPFIGSATVTIEPDTVAPVIGNVSVSDISAGGYTVTCDVSDNVAVQKVAFPTWTVHGDETTPEAQDDLFDQWWETALGNIEDGHVTYRVNTSEHESEANTVYQTHIYAYDVAGNMAGVSELAFPELEVQVPSPIQNVEITNLSTAGYTVSCTLDEAWGPLEKVCFPTWTEPGYQDDLFEYWEETAIGTLEGNRAVYRVETSLHGGEVGCVYLTHIYVWNTAGHRVGVSQDQFSCLRLFVPDMDYDFILPGSTKVIGNSAFEGIGAAAVYIPDGCESIGESAFAHCTNLTYIRIPASVTHIDDTAFAGCPGSLTIRGGTEAQRITLLYGFTFQEDGQ